MDITMIAVDKVQPNKYNPNVVPEKIMELLKKSIETGGIEQPVLVREDANEKGAYIIIDGEHRWKTAKDLGIKHIPCTIKDIDENEAKIQTINMNKLRGEFDSLKLAEVLKSLKDVYTPEELEDKLGYSEIELKSFDDLLDFDPAAFNMDPDALNKVIEADKNSEIMLNEFSVSCSLKQLEIIEAALSVTEEVDKDKAYSLEMVCLSFLEQHAPEKLAEIDDRLKKMAVKVVMAQEKEEKDAKEDSE
jgi:ParB/RepB/Spo0J family partition protein